MRGSVEFLSRGLPWLFLFFLVCELGGDERVKVLSKDGVFKFAPAKSE